MEFLKCFLLLCLVYANRAEHEHHDHKVNVNVYYESMCPDSKKFITKQLHPTLDNQELAKHINLTLIPYGKSETVNSKNEYNFSCHHGAAECYGNKLHACAIDVIKDDPNAKDSGFNPITVDFVNCLLDGFVKKDDDVDFPVKSCAESSKVPNMAEITNCANSTKGSQLLANMGKVTDALQKPLTSVPTVVFDGVYDKSDNDLAQMFFLGALCKHIDHDKPKACNSGAASSTAAASAIDASATKTSTDKDD